MAAVTICGQESLRRNGVAIKVNKRVRNAVLGCNLKNDRMISVRPSWGLGSILVKELRSCKMHSTAKKRKKNQALNIVNIGECLNKEKLV